MPSGSPVALILGAGANVGQSVARAFAAKGYKIALAARSLKEEESTTEQLNIRGDFSDPASVVDIFTKVNAKLGPPHVVVYNAATATFQDPKNPLAVSLEDFNRVLTVNTISALVAAQQAALAFADLPESASKTFIYTGNATNVIAIPALLDAGAGKSASAHIIHCAATAYKDRGMKQVHHYVPSIDETNKWLRFYYADERKADGSPAYSGVDGPAHGKFYTELAEGTSQGPWQQTFVKDIGYKKF